MEENEFVIIALNKHIFHCDCGCGRFYFDKNNSKFKCLACSIYYSDEDINSSWESLGLLSKESEG